MPDRTLDEMITAAVQRGVYAGLVQYSGDPQDGGAIPSRPSAPGAPRRTAYRVAEVATSLGLSKNQVYAMCRSGALDSFREGRSVRIPVEALTAYVVAGDRADS